MFCFIGRYNQPWWCLFRFRDGCLEQRFGERSRAYYVYPARVHFYVRLVFSMIHAGSYVASLSSPLAPFFWMNLSLACFAVVCIALTHVPYVRYRILPFHCFFCCCYIAVTSFMLPEQTTRLIAMTAQEWVPSGGHLLSSGPQGTEVMDSKFHSTVSTMYAQVVLILALNDTTVPWTLLAVSGLNWLTLLTQLFTTAALLASMFLMPRLPPLVYGFTSFTLLFAGLAYFVLSVLIERFRRAMFLSETLLGRELHTSQTADSILNHVLKNTLADVSGIIEMYLAGAEERSALEDAVACLRRGVKSCKERQAYLRLVAGEYVPVLNEVALREFGQSLVAGRAVRSRLPDMTVCLDQTLCNLILENAIGNAFKHGNPEGPDVELAIEVEPAQRPLPTSADSSDSHTPACVTVTVSNAADPLRPPLTEELAARLLKGEAAEGQAFEVRPLLSDRIGLSHCLLAARQGGLAVALWQAGGRVHFQLTMDTLLMLAEPVVDRCDPVEPFLQFPAGLSFMVMDDSLCAQRLLEFHIRRACEPGEVRCFGADESDVPLFLAAALSHADVVITDQHLEYSRAYLGTDLVRHLIAQGFDGLICIRSGDDSREDRAKYAESGAHCSFAKDIPGPQLMEELKQAYLRRRQAGSLPPGSPAVRWATAGATTGSSRSSSASSLQAVPSNFFQSLLLPTHTPALPLPGEPQPPDQEDAHASLWTPPSFVGCTSISSAA